MKEKCQRNQRILVIDDNKSIHEDFRTILGGSGDNFANLREAKSAIFGSVSNSSEKISFEIDSAFQGQEGLEKVRQALHDGHPYAMAFVDIRMPPGWDGVETIQRIWQEYPELQVVICTAYSDYEWTDLIAKLGQTEQLLILKKPFDNVEVYQLASALTEKWYLSKQVQLKHKELERIVEKRTHQLEEANKDLTVALEKAKQAERAKSGFLANMSHEIRTPMNAIIGFGDILADEELTDEQRRCVNNICDGGKHLLGIINDILDFSKIEAGKLDIEFSECSLGQLLNSVESLILPRAEAEGLDFEIFEGDGLPAQICTDVTRVLQCLINLVGNAIKFTREGHIYLKVSLQEIENAPFIRFDVEDTGIGIPHDKQEEIFETFIQADSSTSRVFGGTGLGLTISKRLVELLTGQLTLTSEVGKGSVFSLIIPAGVDVTKQPLLDRHNITSHIEAGKEQVRQVKLSGNILVAEDVRTNQVLIKSLLKRLGLQVTIAEDGNQAVQKALSKQFDLIFMDIEMPNMSGYEATKAIRKEGLKTPIIALTAYAMKGDDEKCIVAGCDDYVSKPIEHKKLLQILSKFLSAENKDMSRQIDSIKSDVEQLNQLCSETASSDSAPTESADEQYGELPVDFAIIKKIYDDEDVLKETVKVFLEEAPQAIELLAEAIKAKDSKNVKMYAHKLKGLARHVAARKITDMLYDLEIKGRKEELEGSEVLFADIQTEFDKLKSFLSQPNWIEK
jgi:signal transduction histidine kinase/HPt (histidine-containing phosphotransfer) domain-containing protein